jgi:DNA ligase 1
VRCGGEAVPFLPSELTVLLAELVSASAAVASTTKRSAKIAELAGLLARLQPDEVEVAVAFLTGEPRQGKIGVGWASLRELMAPAADQPSLTIGEVDSAVERLAGTSGPGSVAQRTGLLGGLFGRATGPEQDFLRRLLLGELRQGALMGIMADAVARAADVEVDAVRRAYMLSGDLGHTAAVALAEGEAGLGSIGLQVGRPVQPMLASTAPSVEAALADGSQASIEWKLDGARIQVHRDGDVVGVFTRNLNDVTHRLPDVVEAARRLPGASFVLDGEVLGFANDDTPRAFQDTISVFARDDGSPVRGLVPFFFDVLHRDGIDLIDLPLSERRRQLEELTGAMAVPAVLTADAAQAERFLRDSLDSGHEGVMVKNASSTYEAGRRGKAWKKVKPVQTLDLVVLAVEWGHGRRQGWLSNLHLGARDPAGGFLMVGKTFKGLTDEMLAWQTERFLALSTGSDGHVVHVRPEQVVEIALDGAQVSPRYPGGVALRFARVRGYRTDKSASEADTIDTVRAMLPGA